MIHLSSYLFVFSLISGLLLTAAAIRLGRRWQVLDVPGPRKIHAAPIPLSGGWGLFATLSLVIWGHVAVAALLPGTSWFHLLPEKSRYFVWVAPESSARLLPLYGGAACMFLIGLLDDLRGLSVRHRLWLQVLAAGGLVLLGVRPSLGFLPPWVAALVGIVWIVGITNAFNFLDGLDGLSTGVSLVATGCLLAVMAIGQQPNMTLLLCVTAGAQLAFLCFNAYPAKVFLGSSGSLLLGYLQAVCTLQATFMGEAQPNWLMPLLIPLFLLAIPIYDTTSVVLIRLSQRRSVAIGDQSHFHHRIMRLGFTHLQAVVFIWLIAAAVGLSAIRLLRASLSASVLILVQILVILAILVLAERVAYRARQRAMAKPDAAPSRVEPVETRDA